MHINYNNRKFIPVKNSESGETTSETLFNYKQSGKILSGSYKGGEIVLGQLIGLVNEEGEIEMSYHQVNTKGEIRTGLCHSIPEILPDGRIRLHETWQWTNGDKEKGTSIIEEQIFL